MLVWWLILSSKSSKNVYINLLYLQAMHLFGCHIGGGGIKKVQGLIRWVKCLPPKCETCILIPSSQGRSQAQLQVCVIAAGEMKGSRKNWWVPDSESLPRFRSLARSAVAFLSLIPHSSRDLSGSFPGTVFECGSISSSRLSSQDRYGWGIAAPSVNTCSWWVWRGIAAPCVNNMCPGLIEPFPFAFNYRDSSS